MSGPRSGPAPTDGPVADPAVAAAHRHLHDDAVAVLHGWTAPDAQQERLRLDYLAHLGAHPDAVAKAGPPAHLTASCLVLDEAGERALLTLHRRAQAWFQLGGHLEAGDASVWAAARREAREESGIEALEPLARPVQLDRHVLVGSFGRCREHLDVRYVARRPGRRRRPGERRVARRAVVAGRRAARGHPCRAHPARVSRPRRPAPSPALRRGRPGRRSPRGRRRPGRRRRRAGAPRRGPARRGTRAPGPAGGRTRAAVQKAGPWPGTSRWASSWSRT